MKHFETHNYKSNFVLEQGQYSYVYIRNFEIPPLEEIADHDAVVIEVKNLDFVRLIVNAVRSNLDPDIYLTPIFLLKKDVLDDVPYIEELVDGSIKSLDDLGFVNKEIDKINIRKNSLNITSSVSFEAQVITKLIALMYVRELKVLNPIPDKYSNLYYSFPFMAINFEEKEEHLALKILNLAEEEGMLRSEYFDRVYLCSSCSGSHMSYREVCPKCSSSNTTPSDIIHHFPCGYVGPMKDFSNEIDDKLDCPKCNKRLRHIGVDYDKPSVIHHCNNCSHNFQDYNVNAKCMSCHTDRSVETLKAHDIKTYRLTKKGELAAIKGFTSTSKDIEDVMGTVKYDTFKTMLKYEIERLKQTLGDSNLCAIHIGNSSQVYSKLGSELQRGVFKDLVSVIRSNIRSSDVIAFWSSSTIVVSMNDIPHKIALRITGEMVELLSELIKSSFDDLEVNFETKTVALDYRKPHEMQLRELLAEFD